MYDANVNFIRERIVKFLPIYKYTTMTTNPRYVEEKYSYWYFLNNSGIKEAMKMVCGEKEYTIFNVQILNEDVVLSEVYIPVGYGLATQLPQNLVSAIVKECNKAGSMDDLKCKDDIKNSLESKMIQLAEIKETMREEIRDALQV